MDTSNVYRYLVSFCGAGLAAQGADSRYDLGPFAIQMGLAALSRIDGLDIAIKGLANLVDRVALDGHVCVFGSAGVTVVRWVGRPREIVFRASEGTILSPLTTATGRLWGAFLDGAAFDEVLNADLVRRSAAEGSSKKHLRAEYERRIDAVRRLGLSLSQGERRVGFDALCGPVFDRDGSLAFSITLMGPPRSFDPGMNEMPARCLRQTVTQISRDLGADRKALMRYPWFNPPKGSVLSSGPLGQAHDEKDERSCAAEPISENSE